MLTVNSASIFCPKGQASDDNFGVFVAQLDDSEAHEHLFDKWLKHRGYD
jgi:hypothetical protein